MWEPACPFIHRPCHTPPIRPPVFSYRSPMLARLATKLRIRHVRHYGAVCPTFFSLFLSTSPPPSCTTPCPPGGHVNWTFHPAAAIHLAPPIPRQLAPHALPRTLSLARVITTAPPPFFSGLDDASAFRSWTTSLTISLFYRFRTSAPPVYTSS